MALNMSRTQPSAVRSLCPPRGRNNMELRELLEKTADTDFVRDMIGFTAQRLMELDVDTLTGATHGSRNADRLTHRNG